MDHHWEHLGSSSSAHYSCTRAMESKYGVKILNYKTLFMNSALVQFNSAAFKILGSSLDMQMY